MDLKLKVLTDGTPGGTKLVNADTGEEVKFPGGGVTANIDVNKKRSRADVVISLSRIPVEVELADGAEAKPFTLVGHRFN